MSPIRYNPKNFLILILTIFIFVLLIQSGFAQDNLISVEVGESVNHKLVIENPLVISDDIRVDIQTTERITAWFLGHEGESSIDLTIDANSNDTKTVVVIANYCENAPKSCPDERITFKATSRWTGSSATKVVDVMVLPSSKSGTLGKAPDLSPLYFVVLLLLGAFIHTLL